MNDVMHHDITGIIFLIKSTDLSTFAHHLLAVVPISLWLWQKHLVKIRLSERLDEFDDPASYLFV